VDFAKQLVDAGDCGLSADLVDPHDPAAIRSGLAALFADDRLHGQLAGAAPSNAARFDWDASATALAHLFAEAVAVRRGAKGWVRETRSRTA